MPKTFPRYAPLDEYPAADKNDLNTWVETLIPNAAGQLVVGTGDGVIPIPLNPGPPGASLTSTGAGLGWSPVGTFNVVAYGAKGDGTTDDTAAIQSAIDAAYAGLGGIVLFAPGNYRCVGLVLKSGVVLLGQAGRRSSGNSKYAVRLTQAAAGPVIDTPSAAACDGAEINGFQIIGLGAATAGNGIRFRDANQCAVKNTWIHGVADEAIKVDSTSINCVFEDIYVTQAVLNRTRAAKIGAFDIDGTDHMFQRVGGGCSTNLEGTVTSANLYCCAWVVRGGQHFFTACFGEISDVGWHQLTGTAGGSRFTNCRADLNYGHGWEIAGGANSFSTCAAMSNGQAATNTYDNWQALSTSANNTFAACVAASVTTNKPRYGFNDLQSGAATKNGYANCISTGALTAQYSTATSNGSGFLYAPGTWKTLTANAATPDVNGFQFFVTANSSPTTVTDFLNGTQGQILTIFCNDSNTTIQHNGATITSFLGTVKLIQGRHYQFVKNGGTWRDITTYQDLSVGADVGDAAKTLAARQHESTQRWATPLTAARAVSLSTTGAFSGAKFRIVRTAAATGAFTLDVGTGPLKSLAAGQWCDVEYQGAAWMLTAFGSL